MPSISVSPGGVSSYACFNNVAPSKGIPSKSSLSRFSVSDKGAPSMFSESSIDFDFVLYCSSSRELIIS